MKAPTARRRTGALLLAMVGLILTACGTGSPDPDPDPDSGSGSGSEESEMAPSTADWMEYATLKEATQASKLIVVGKPQGSRESEAMEESGLTGGIPVTLTNLEVTDVIKGEKKVGDQLVVGQTGTAAQPEIHTTYLTDIDAEQVLLFFPLLGEGFFEPFNPEQGVYIVDGDTVLPLPGARAALPVKSLSQLSRLVAKTQS